MAFCGQTATSIYCPGSDSSPAPPSTYDVTVGLYKHIIQKTDEVDRQYKSELREALKGLVRDDRDVWTSVYQDFSKTWWMTRYPLWKDAVKKKLDIENGWRIADWIKDGAYPLST